MLNGASNLKVVALGGSLREGSFCYLALEHVANLLSGLGCETQVLDLRTMQLPFFNGDSEDPRLDHPRVAELRCAVWQSDALVLATPEYHSSVSGALKNALDLLSREHLEGKVAGVIGVLGGGGKSNALSELGRILQCFHAWVLPQSITVGRAEKVFVNGEISDVDLRRRFDVFAESLVRSTVRLLQLQPT